MTLAHKSFSEGKMRIFLPAEPLFVYETPQIPALCGQHLDK
jgi:hypothetical protein